MKKTTIYFLWQCTQQINGLNKIFKIGSTKDLFNRMMTYKTSYVNFIDNKITKLYCIELDECEIKNAYYFDELLKELTKKINSPYSNMFYNGSSGGTEYYSVDDNECYNFNFFLDIVNKLTKKGNYKVIQVSIEELFSLHISDNNPSISDIVVNENSIFGIDKKCLKDDVKKIIDGIKQSIYLRKWQIECLKNINNMKEKSGVVIAPTGTGKSHLIIELIKKFIKYGKRIMYITKRKEVLNDMYNRTIESLDDPKISIIKNIRDIDHQVGFMNLGKVENVNNKIKASDFKNKFDIILIDECHWAGSPKAYKFLEKLKKSVNKIIGFSATPLRLEGTNQQNNFNLFGTGIDLNIIYQLSYLNAIDNNYIMALERRLMLINEEEIEEDDDENNENIKRIFKAKSLNDVGKEKLMKELNKLIGESEFKKGIIYFGNTKQLLQFKEFYNNTVAKYNNLEKLRLFVSYVNDKSTFDAPKKFKEQKLNAILFVIKRCAEGFDDPKLEVGALGYVAKSYDPILLIQREGRLSRILKEKKTPRFITLIYNDNAEDFITTLVQNMAKLVKGFGFSNKNNINKEIDEIYKRFNNFVEIVGELKISKEDFNRKVFNIAYGSEEIRIKRYLIDMNFKLFKNNNELICTKNKVVSHLKKKGESSIPNPTNGNWVKYSIGDKLFEIMKSNYYYTKEEIKKACHNLNIYDFDDYIKNWKNDSKLPNEEWINKGGFYYDMDEKFNIQEYFIIKSYENINSF